MFIKDYAFEVLNTKIIKCVLLITVIALCYSSDTTARETNEQDEFWTITLKRICKESSLIAKKNGDAVRVNLENNHNWAYAGVIEIGNPPQPVRIEFDTGSADLWVISSEMSATDPESYRGHYSYNHADSVTYSKDGRNVELQYGTGVVKGFMSQDDVLINGIKIEGQKFLEVTSKTVSYNYVKYTEKKDGILGLGFPNISAIYNMTDSPSPLCNLVNRGLIKQPVFSFYHNKVEPTTETGQTGELVLGGINPKHFTGKITFTPVLEGAPNWIINVDGIMLGEDEIGKDVVSMIDSGTSRILGPKEIVDPIKRAVFGDDHNKKKTNVVACSIVNSLPDVTFIIKGVKLILKPEDYVVKEYSNEECLFGFSEIPRERLVMGNVFMRKFYTVFDFGNMRIGFAAAK